jgi:hypothetical protein
MLMRALLRTALVAAVAMPILATSAKADVVIFDTWTYITGDNGIQPDENIATVTITDTDTDEVTIRLDHLNISQAGQFISSLWMNVSGVTDLSLINTTGDGELDNFTFDLDGVNNASIKFDMLFDLDTSQDGRLGPGEFIEFTLSGTGLNATDFLTFGEGDPEIYAMIHVQGLDNEGSVKLGAVPEPASMAALAIGAAALIRRRRKN